MRPPDPFGTGGQVTLRTLLAATLAGGLGLSVDTRADPDVSWPETNAPAETTGGQLEIEPKVVEDPEALSDAEERALTGEDNPMGLAEAQRDAQRAEEVEGTPGQTTGFDVYGSLRVRYRTQGANADWQDGGSRMGTEANLQLRRGSFLFGRYEAGFNMLAGLEGLTTPGERTGEFEDTLFTRLGYAGLDSPGLLLVFGKNWSSYYDVAGFTDRFMGTGASASGVFNAQSDGGATGTGRADQTLQSKLTIDFLPERIFRPFEMNLQLQHGNPIPFAGGTEYGTAVGLSAVATTRRNNALSVAYNHAHVDMEGNPSLRDIGLTGSARALLLGTRSFGERWYVGLLASRLEDHETTDEEIYFDGWGSELYGEYHLVDRIWLVGGYNVLEPDSDQEQAGDYRVRYGVVGLRYTFDGFRQMLFANVRLDDSRGADGSSRSDIYTVGLRWDLSRRGWRLSR